MGGRSGEPLRQAGRLSRALAEEGEDDRREHHGPYRQGGENEGRCARDVPDRAVERMHPLPALPMAAVGRSDVLGIAHGNILRERP